MKRSDIFNKRKSSAKNYHHYYDPDVLYNYLSDDSLVYAEAISNYDHKATDGVNEYDISEDTADHEALNHAGSPEIADCPDNSAYAYKPDAAEGESILKYIKPCPSAEEVFEEDFLDIMQQNLNDSFNSYRQPPRLDNSYTGGSGLYDNYEYYDFSYLIQSVLKELLNQYTFMSLEGQLYVYDSTRGFYRLLPPDSRNRSLRSLLSKGLIGRVTKRELGELYEWLVLNANQVREYQLSQNLHYINFAECAYDFENDVIIDNRQKLYFRYALSISYPRKKKSTGKFKKFIKQIFKNDPDTLREIKKFFGLAISNIRCLNLAFIFYGTSSTGKTTLLNLLNLLIDPECTVCLSFSQLTNDSTVNGLIGKHICTTSSIAGMSGRSSKRMDMFKCLVGNDLISVHQNGGGFVNFRNRSLLVLACDYLPEITNVHEVSGFVSKVIIFPFKNVFNREDWEMFISNKVYCDTAGIVEFAIEGLKDLKLCNYKFNESEAMRAAKDEFQGNLESFTLFAEKYLKRSKKSRLLTAEIGIAYSRFCGSTGYPCLKTNQWTVILQKIFKCDHIMASENGIRLRGYSGITFTKEIHELCPEWADDTAADDAQYSDYLDNVLHDNQDDRALDILKPDQDDGSPDDQDVPRSNDADDVNEGE